MSAKEKDIVEGEGAPCGDTACVANADAYGVPDAFAGAFDVAYCAMMKCVHEHELFSCDNAICAMVSGGSDSTALAYLLARARDEGEIGALTFLHVNHCIRGAQSLTDARFVERIADALDVPLFLCEVDIPRLICEFGGNLEDIARRERYSAAAEALASMCEHEGYPPEKGLLASAHTADDRIEAFYMRSIVGTGPGGFRAMRYDRDRYLVRPLLDLSRDDLRAAIFDLAAQGRAVAAAFDTEGIAAAGGFADQNSVPAYWREDATNADTDRFRAYVRHEIVPVARKWNASLATTLTRTMNLIADEDDMLDEFADEEIWEHAMPIDTLDKRSCDAAATGSKADVSIFEDSCRMRQVEDVFVDGCVLAPEFGEVRRPIARRAVIKLLHAMLGAEARIEAASVAGVLNAYDAHTHLPQGGYVVNIQGNLAVSANKLGVRIEPMAAFRARRKRR